MAVSETRERNTSNAPVIPAIIDVINTVTIKPIVMNIAVKTAITPNPKIKNIIMNIKKGPSIKMFAKANINPTTTETPEAIIKNKAVAVMTKIEMMMSPRIIIIEDMSPQINNTTAIKPTENTRTAEKPSKKMLAKTPMITSTMLTPKPSNINNKPAYQDRFQNISKYKCIT
jgi:hypothetical protein